jgi:hypothetical protein
MKAISFLLISFAIIFSINAQEADDLSKAPKPFSPTIGVGIGTIGFYGDLNDRNYGSPLGSNIGYNVYVLQPITKFLSVKFNFTIAEIKSEERSIVRNVNFNTDIRSGGIYVEYNFDNFLPEDRFITPFITSGIESIEFNPKTDLEGANGEQYNYWSDGTIRNIAENSTDADIAVLVQRDYSYETDLREAGFNPTKDYLERTFAIPVGGGITMHLNDQFDFRFESVWHFSFSDYMDGITPETSSDYVGGKKGNVNNDYYWFNGVSISYNFQKVDSGDKFDKLDNEPIDYSSVGNTEDYDNDGVIDLIDNCPDTPRDVEVDSLGCAVDNDGDGVPDYKDEELDTEYPEYANHKGVEQTDDMIYNSYLNYIDSSGANAEIIERDFRGSDSKKKPTYKVQLGEFSKGDTPENMGNLLNLSDLNKINQDNKTIFAAGNFKSYADANKRLKELSNQGFDNLVIIKKNSNGKYSSMGKPRSKTQSTSTETPVISDNTSGKEPAEDVVVFRVQLGAFKKKPTDDLSKKILDLIVVQSGGYYRYMSGSFDNFNDAAAHKIKMSVEGYKGAFVVAYKNGKRVPLKSVGVKTINSDPIIGK